jgi:phosphonate transport system permease protein
MTDVDDRIAVLRAARPRSRFLRVSLLMVVLLIVAAWWSGEFDPGDLFTQRRLANVERFLTVDIVPQARDGTPLPPSEWFRWASELLATSGREAIATTLAISIAAIVFAWGASLIACLPAARSLMCADPYLGAERSKADRPWRAAAATVRLFLILLRSIPEYVLTFLLVSLLGISAWPAVLALAIHNAGILGKLNAEVVENLDGHRFAALRGVGATRAQIAAFGVYPSALSRFLLYFFYRWETCLREATVLGMLGIISLGRLIGDATVRRSEDQLVFYVLLGAAMVLIGDLVSAVARAQVRRAR